VKNEIETKEQLIAFEKTTAKNKNTIIVHNEQSRNLTLGRSETASASVYDDRPRSARFNDIDKVFHPQFIEMLGKDI
jgi:hypothetical protein